MGEGCERGRAARHPKRGLIVLDGGIVGVVKTRAEATKWWKRTMADLKRMEIAITREVKARRYALHL